jgi:acyl-CoA reductase-like NAD-dependent aldehyde dehydrogenase
MHLKLKSMVHRPLDFSGNSKGIAGNCDTSRIWKGEIVQIDCILSASFLEAFFFDFLMSTSMAQHKMWIGGDWVEAESGKTYPVYNPATEEEIGQIPLGGAADADKAVAAARKALLVWSKKSQAERSQIALKIAAVLREHHDELAALDVMEHGTPAKRADFINADLPEWFEWTAYNARSLMGHTVPNSANELDYLQREPVGVIALITPWNYPLLMIIEKLAPALTLGNTCIIKPPSIDSLTALKLAELLDTAGLPPGAVNVITGPGGKVGSALASHRGVDMVAFTGSCEVGKELMMLGSKTLKRLQLELGGKNPVIILDDADIETAAAEMAPAQFRNCGQVCASPGRFYVHAKVYDRFLAKFIEVTKKMTVGDPTDWKTMIGPVVSKAHRDTVEGYIQSAIDEGAKVILGGKRPTAPPMDKGYWVLPTVITGVTQKMRVAREEIFGPVAVFMEPFNFDEEVIEKANDNTFGLAAYVWTTDAARGMRFINELQAGTVTVGNVHGKDLDLPWGGYKESGIGKEHSLYGLYEYTNLKRAQVDIKMLKK